MFFSSMVFTSEIPNNVAAWHPWTYRSCRLHVLPTRKGEQARRLHVDCFAQTQVRPFCEMKALLVTHVSITIAWKHAQVVSLSTLKSYLVYFALCGFKICALHGIQGLAPQNKVIFSHRNTAMQQQLNVSNILLICNVMIRVALKIKINSILPEILLSVHKILIFLLRHHVLIIDHYLSNLLPLWDINLRTSIYGYFDKRIKAFFNVIKTNNFSF